MIAGHDPELQRIERLFARADFPVASGVTIACFYTSDGFPLYSAPMPRNPLPRTGATVDPQLLDALTAGFAANPSIHDGALMFGRPKADRPYELTGWSFRLFPPNGRVLTRDNRGSAYNTCLHMSVVDGVDFLLTVSNRERWQFAFGQAKLL
jgi:hypothetical protein